MAAARRSASPPEQHTIEIEGRPVAWTINRSARRQKTLAIRVVPPGTVVVTAPAGASTAEIRALVQRQAPWIAKRLEAGPPAPPPAPALLAGSPMPLLGETLDLAFRAGAPGYLRARRDGPLLAVTLPPGVDPGMHGAPVREVIERWYRARTHEFATAAVEEWAPRAGISPARVMVREQKRRWGSCSKDGTLRFNWRLAMLDHPLAEYVVVHELCHLLHLDHSKAFWGEVARVMPAFAVTRAALRSAARGLPL